MQFNNHAYQAIGQSCLLCKRTSPLVCTLALNGNSDSQLGVLMSMVTFHISFQTRFSFLGRFPWSSHISILGHLHFSSSSISRVIGFSLTFSIFPRILIVMLTALNRPHSSLSSMPGSGEVAARVTQWPALQQHAMCVEQRM